MQSVVPTVVQLLKQLGDAIGTPQPTGEPWKLPPLDFEGAASSRSYKHPWVQATAKSSLETSGLYEASGSVLWCNPWPTDDCDDPQVTMGEVRRCAEFFQQAMLTSGRACRITFPCSVLVVVESARDADRQAFNASLEVLTGHAYGQA